MQWSGDGLVRVLVLDNRSPLSNCRFLPCTWGEPMWRMSHYSQTIYSPHNDRIVNSMCQYIPPCTAAEADRRFFLTSADIQIVVSDICNLKHARSALKTKITPPQQPAQHRVLRIVAPSSAKLDKTSRYVIEFAVQQGYIVIYDDDAGCSFNYIVWEAYRWKHLRSFGSKETFLAGGHYPYNQCSECLRCLSSVQHFCWRQFLKRGRCLIRSLLNKAN